MTLFGPVYPPPLQRLINHVECVSLALGRLQRFTCEMDPTAAAWLQGRDEEVVTYLADILSERSEGKLDDIQTANAIAHYLSGIHKGIQLVLRLWPPPCCVSEDAATVDAGEPVWPKPVEVRVRTNENATIADSIVVIPFEELYVY